MHNKYGASLGNMIRFANNPNTFEDMLIRELVKVSPTELEKLYKYPTDLGESSHLLVTTRPSETDPTLPTRDFPSEYVLNRICKQVFKDRADQLSDFYCILREEPQTSAAAGMLFEAQVHRFLRKGGRFNLFRIKDRDSNYVFSNFTGMVTDYLILPDSKEVITTKATMVTPELNVYYHPAKNFTIFDSWILTQPHPQEPPVLLTFQMAFGQNTRTVDSGSLRFMDKVVPGFDRWLIVVTNSEMGPEFTGPKEYLEELNGQSLDEEFPVFHLPLTKEDVFVFF